MGLLGGAGLKATTCVCGRRAVGIIPVNSKYTEEVALTMDEPGSAPHLSPLVGLQGG